MGRGGGQRLDGDLPCHNKGLQWLKEMSDECWRRLRVMKTMSYRFVVN